MKAKISPTSPKYRIEELEKLYSQEGLKKIEKPPRRLPHLFLVIMLAIIFGFLAGLVGKVTFDYLSVKYPSLNFNINTNSTANTVPIIDATRSVIKYNELKQEVSASVVNIFKKKSETKDTLVNVYLPADSVGQGLIVASNGLIVTTKGAVNDFAQEYVAVSKDKTVYQGSDFILDPVTDLVFFKIKATNLKAVDFSDTASLYAGMSAYILKDFLPLGQENFLITNLTNINNRPSAAKEDLISSSERLSARITVNFALDETYEGSPLFEDNGKIIGLAQVKGMIGKNQFVSLAAVKKIMSNVLKGQGINRPYLGINFLDLSQVGNLPSILTYDHKAGVLLYGDEKVVAVVKNSPAEKSGLLANDIILKVNGETLTEESDFARIIQDFSVGDTVTFSLLRKGVAMEVSVKFEKMAIQ